MLWLMPRRARQVQALGELESAVVEALWERGELSTPAVYANVGVPRGLAYTTILTVLQRLVKKELAKRRLAGRSHVYTAALSREQFAERRAHSLASTFVEIGAAGVATFLSETERLDPQMVALLRKRLR